MSTPSSPDDEREARQVQPDPPGRGRDADTLRSDRSGADRRGLARWLDPGGVTAVIAGTGILAYLILYYGCVWAYEPLGVEPSEVGLDYAHLLAGSAAGGLLLLFALIGAAVFLGAMRSVLRRGSGSSRLRSLAILYGLSFFFVVLSYLFIYAAGTDTRVKDGERPRSFLGVVPFPWDAKVAHVTWLQPAPSGKTLASTCVLYLGRADGVSVFYNPSNDSAIHVPTTAVRMRIQGERCES